MLHSVHRLWIDGKANVITDCGSRAGWVDKVARYVTLPVQSVMQTIRELFTAPEELAAKYEARNKQLKNKKWEPIAENSVQLQYHQLELEAEPHVVTRPVDLKGKESSHSNFTEGVTCTDWAPDEPMAYPGSDGEAEETPSFAGDDATLSAQALD